MPPADHTLKQPRWAVQLADPKLDERQVLMCALDHDGGPLAERPALPLIADKGYISAGLDHYPHARGATLLRRLTATARPGPVGRCWSHFGG
ncbi:hypothetical protein JOD57_003916 [Geodermatophilus bullaregiensis]|nr:hypothetical protein [Geodermatophilus bullaregiensis]MBM7808079.1 hypothetical protein [Geodermatophilus bullaregiensis]